MLGCVRGAGAGQASEVADGVGSGDTARGVETGLLLTDVGAVLPDGEGDAPDELMRRVRRRLEDLLLPETEAPRSRGARTGVLAWANRCS